MLAPSILSVNLRLTFSRPTQAAEGSVKSPHHTLLWETPQLVRHSTFTATVAPGKKPLSVALSLSRAPSSPVRPRRPSLRRGKSFRRTATASSLVAPVVKRQPRQRPLTARRPSSPVRPACAGNKLTKAHVHDTRARRKVGAGFHF